MIVAIGNIMYMGVNYAPDEEIPCSLEDMEDLVESGVAAYGEVEKDVPVEVSDIQETPIEEVFEGEIKEEDIVTEEEATEAAIILEHHKDEEVEASEAASTLAKHKNQKPKAPFKKRTNAAKK